MNFSKYARQYRWMTDHALWHANMREIAKQLPPSGSQLKLLDIACGTGSTLRDLHALRPDILPIGIDLAAGMIQLASQRNPIGRYIHGNALTLPFATDSLDAVVIQRTYYFLPDKTPLLAEALRVLRPGGRLVMVDPTAGKSPWGAWRVGRYGFRPVVDMFALHLAAKYVGGYTPESIAGHLADAGFARILAEPILDGWAVMSRGEKPYPSGTSTPDRITRGAGTDAAAPTLLHGEDIHSMRGRFVHLLIQQQPNKPVWALRPGEVITWGAAAMRGADGQPVLLAFSALPKAVEMMQAAVLADAIRDVNKVAKFSKATAATWDYPILLNPDLATVQGHLLPERIAIDPASAEAPDE